MTRHGQRTAFMCIICAFLISGCEQMRENPSFDDDLDVIDETGLNDIMLTMADPNDAANHFQRLMAREPDDPEHMRGLAVSLVRARRAAEAAPVYNRLIATGQATTQDRLLYAESLVAAGAIDQAEEQLDQIPPNIETYKRYLLEAIVADHNKEWDKADSFYGTARGLTARPAAVLNNWGMSKMARGDLTEAANLFQDAIAFDPKMFPAKNNLITARGNAKNYRMPVIPTTEIEEATLLYNLGIIAVRNGDTDIAKGLFDLAIETHPQFYKEATDALAALGGVS